MGNTYINEGMTAHYPFLPDCSLPFSNSIITDIRLCIGDGVSGVRVTRVEVSGGYVKATVTARVSGMDVIVAMLKAPYGPAFGGIDEVLADGVSIGGFMATGIVSAEDEGVYAGLFELAPPCVLAMPPQEVPALKGFSAGGVQAGTADALELRSEGFLSLSLGTASAGVRSITASGPQGQWDWLYSGVDAPVMVTAVNGVPAGTSTGRHALELDFSQSGATVSASSASGGMFICVEVIGGTSFPNCYSAAADQADKSDAEQKLTDGGL